MSKRTTIVRATLLSLAGLGAAGWLSASLMAGGQGAKTTESHQMPMAGTGMMMTKDQKIGNAMTAAPASVSASATIADWPAQEGDRPAILRSGTNGWTCLPDMPHTQGNDPMCVDRPWMTWLEALLAQAPPRITTAGVGYMIAPGGAWGSNTEPYAMAATADNQWGFHHPHLMLLVPDLKSLEGISTDPENGGPYVMYKGTPYAHIMAPITTSTSRKP